MIRSLRPGGPRRSAERRPDHRRRSAWAALFIVGLVLPLALLLGLLSAVLPWQYVLVLGTIGLVLPISVRFPEIGMVVMLLLVFEAIPAGLVPALPIGGGKVNLYDVLLAITAVTVTVRAAWRGDSLYAPTREVLLPVGYVLLCVALAWFYGKFVLNNPLATSESRSSIHWLTLPLLLVLVDTPRKLRWLIWFTIGVASLTAFYGAIQSLFDVRFLSKRVEDLATGSSIESGGITRSLIGAGSFLGIFSIYYLTMMVLARRARWWLALPLIVLALVALAVSFTRAFWVGAFVGGLLAFFLYRGIVAAVVAGMIGAVAVAVALAAIALVKPQTAEAVVERMTGFTEEVRSGGSFGWRKRENEAALKVIEERPLLGVGAGGIYKKTRSGAGSWEGEYTFIHNGYLAFPLKMGLHAALVPFFFIAAFVLQLVRALRHADAGERIVPASAAGVFLTVVLAAYTEPHWGRVDSITAIGLLFVLVIQSRRLRADDATPVPKRPVRGRPAFGQPRGPAFGPGRPSPTTAA